MSPRSQLVVLVGPKGSGKTTLGRMLARARGWHFLEVELIAKRVLAASGNVIDEGYAKRAFDAIVSEVDTIDTQYSTIVLETTGASDQTERFLAALREGHALCLVRVVASEEVCAARIDARDPSRQVQVSRELVREMHARTEALDLEWDLVVVNDPPLSADQVEAVFAPLFDVR
jgi:shikimate kinase